jgi:hypothetical protein
MEVMIAAIRLMMTLGTAMAAIAVIAIIVARPAVV